MFIMSAKTNTQPIMQSYTDERKYEFFAVGSNPNKIDPSPPQDIIDKYPKFKNLYEAIAQQQKLCNLVRSNPTIDFVYELSGFRYAKEVVKEDGKVTSVKVSPFPSEFIDAPASYVIAGSAAVAQVVHYLWTGGQQVLALGYLMDEVNELCRLVGMNEFTILPESADSNLRYERQTKMRQLAQYWVAFGKDHSNPRVYELAYKLTNPRYDYPKAQGQNSDTDIFILGSAIPQRLILPGLDIVHTPAKTVSELLLNFDLPCCRAAFDARGKVWVSVQCLYSLFTGQYFLPAYTQNEKRMKELLIKHRGSDPMKHSEHFLFGRLMTRIEKYKKRGFEAVFVETDVVLPWIRNRFHYGEWYKNIGTTGTVDTTP